MSSSTTSIPSRSRSLRKPVLNSNNNNTSAAKVSSGGVTDGAANVRDGGARTLSPTRLPVKGSSSLSIARSASTRVASTSKTSGGRGAVPPSPTAAGAPKKTRPLSTILGRSRAESVPKEDTGSSRDVLSSRPPRTAATRPPIAGTGQQSRPPSSSGPSRSTSMARPTSSSGVPSGSSNSRLARAPTGHARTKSSITSLTGATTLRPPSQTSVDSGGSSSAAAAAAAPDRSRPPITRSAAAAHRRNVSSSSAVTTTSSVSTRPKQAPSSSSRQQQQQQQPLSPPAVPVPTATTADHHRPVFTTLQQHYSPAKSLAPKPLTSTFLAPPSPSKLPSNVALSAEISRLQTELLQLHLLHRDAHTVAGQWRGSAKHKLGDRFASTVKLEEQVGKIEESVVETRNLRALVDWGSQGAGLESKIQMLDEVVCGMWALGEPGGRYTRVVRRYEKWAGRVKEVSEARKLFDQIRAGDGKGQQVTSELLGNEGLADLLLMNGTSSEEETRGKILLNAEWKVECAMLVRRLTEWRRILKGLIVSEQGLNDTQSNSTATKNGTTVATETRERSSLARILVACRSLVHDMLTELDLMEQMERDVVAAENAWVRAVNRDEDEHGELLPLRRNGGNNTRAGAIWRAF